MDKEECDDYPLEPCPECGYVCSGVLENGPCPQYRDSFYDLDDYGDFQNPGGVSALRRETADNPRNLPCSTCGEPDRLTPKDVEQGYQCDWCAEQDEIGP